MISSLIVGGIVGSWLGARVADLRYRPTPDGAPALKVGKGWVVAIAVLGWIVGGAIGMGLTALFSRTLRTMWLVPILFFTPPVVCLVLGGFAGLGIAPAGRPGERASEFARNRSRDSALSGNVVEGLTIALTGAGRGIDEQWLRGAGFDHDLTKPNHVEALLNVIGRLLLHSG